MKRREFLGLGCTATVAAVAFMGLPTHVVANTTEDTKRAENKARVNRDIKKRFGTDARTESDRITLKAPDIAENGMAVPITVSTDIENAQRIAVYVDSNPVTHAASFKLFKGTHPKYSTRIKMGGTGIVTVIVEDSNGKLYEAKKEVKVTVGGCGG
jgi:sulfur-oxidizing protein SoxY